MDPSAGGSVDDVIARNMAADSAPEETTVKPEQHEIKTRSLNDDKMVFTRSGAYRLIESRLNA